MFKNEGLIMAPEGSGDDKKTEYSVPPVVRAIAVMRYIAAGNRCRNITKAAKSLGINRTTLIRLLATLESEAMIELVDEDAGYRLGTGLISLASEALNDRSIMQVARPFLRRLVNELQLSAHLGILDGREIVYLLRETPNSHLASNVREGTRLPAHATTIGRILLAQQPRVILRQLYGGKTLDSFTEKTQTTLEALEAQIERDRDNGIAWSEANFEPGIGSAAVVVYDHLGSPAGAINVTGHASEFSPESGKLDQIEVVLKSTARDLSEALGYRGWASDQM